jgi:hypothetical protein
MRMGENRNSFTVFIGKPEEVLVFGGRRIL